MTGLRGSQATASAVSARLLVLTQLRPAPPPLRLGQRGQRKTRSDRASRTVPPRRPLPPSPAVLAPKSQAASRPSRTARGPGGDPRRPERHARAGHRDLLESLARPTCTLTPGGLQEVGGGVGGAGPPALGWAEGGVPWTRACPGCETRACAAATCHRARWDVCPSQPAARAGQRASLRQTDRQTDVAPLPTAAAAGAARCPRGAWNGRLNETAGCVRVSPGSPPTTLRRPGTRPPVPTELRQPPPRRFAHGLDAAGFPASLCPRISQPRRVYSPVLAVFSAIA